MHIFNNILLSFDVAWLISVITGMIITKYFYDGDVDEYMDNCHVLFIIFIARGAWIFSFSLFYFLVLLIWP